MHASTSREPVSGSRLPPGPLKNWNNSYRSAFLPEHPSFRWQAHHDLADCLEMDGAALALLRAGVDVAHPALHRVVLENRRRAGRLIDGRDDIARLMDSPSRRE